MKQHMQALEQANRVRLSRAELKRAVLARDLMVAEVLLGEIPDWLEGMRLEELCNAIPRFGWQKYQRLMQDTQTGLFATVGGLTGRQRHALGERLGEWEAAAEIPDTVRRKRARSHRGIGTHTASRRTAL